jgi:hypothetical protein
VAECFELFDEAAGAVLDRAAAGEPVRPQLAEGGSVAGDVVVGDQDVVAGGADRLLLATAAACRTASQPSSARSTVAGSITSPSAVSTSSTPSGASAAGTRSGDRAKTRTRCPARTSAAIECEQT